jgi:hypothetical protein
MIVRLRPGTPYERTLEAIAFRPEVTPWPPGTYQLAHGWELRDRGFRTPLHAGDVVLRTIPQTPAEARETRTVAVMAPARFRVTCEVLEP